MPVRVEVPHARALAPADAREAGLRRRVLEPQPAQVPIEVARRRRGTGGPRRGSSRWPGRRRVVRRRRSRRGRRPRRWSPGCSASCPRRRKRWGPGVPLRRRRRGSRPGSEAGRSRSASRGGEAGSDSPSPAGHATRGGGRRRPGEGALPQGSGPWNGEVSRLWPSSFNQYAGGIKTAPERRESPRGGREGVPRTRASSRVGFPVGWVDAEPPKRRLLMLLNGREEKRVGRLEFQGVCRSTRRTHRRSPICHIKYIAVKWFFWSAPIRDFGSEDGPISGWPSAPSRVAAPSPARSRPHRDPRDPPGP